FEQAARNMAGMPMTFNGTCGVWRRDAIDQAGGWRGDSVAEDQDLSFRAFTLGWRCRLLLDVSAAGEPEVAVSDDAACAGAAAGRFAWGR
ncbi:MAG: hypothetical protein J0H36_09965, partial [Hyphomicrobium denitrificans]|nr:hypothetical protein [Hyphomicrobium denitrificans]